MLALKIYMLPKLPLIASKLLIKLQIQAFLLIRHSPGGLAVTPQEYYGTHVPTVGCFVTAVAVIYLEFDNMYMCPQLVVSLRQWLLTITHASTLNTGLA